jgi:anti-sigma factor RsiW
MIWNNRCRETQHILALSVGNDLGQHHQEEIERHLATCPACREISRELQQSQQALNSMPANPPVRTEPSASIWPEVARQISSVSVAPRESAWRSWLPTGALAAACLAVWCAIAPSLSPVGGGGSPANSQGRVSATDVMKREQPSRSRIPDERIRKDPDWARNF